MFEPGGNVAERGPLATVGGSPATLRKKTGKWG